MLAVGKVVVRAALGAVLLAACLPVPLRADGPCDVLVELDAAPRDPMDGDLVTYGLRYCDTTGYGASVFNAYFGVTAGKFVPLSGEWTSCPTGNCAVSGTGDLSIGGFELPPDGCEAFEFTLRLQTGQGNASICEQGSTTVKSHSPPEIGFTCPKRTDDPATATLQDATCVTVQDPTPGCDIQAVAEPQLLATCAGSGDSLTAENSTQNGCPGGVLAYQWRRNGVDIPGATAARYQIPLDEPVGGAQYRVLVVCGQLPACQQLSNQVQVTIFQSSAVLFAPSSACAGDTVDVFVQSGITCTIDCGNGAAPVNACVTRCTYAAPGRFPITATADDGLCVADLEQAIDVFDQPRACLDVPASICEGDPGGPTFLRPGNCSALGLVYGWTSDLGDLDDPAAREPDITLPDVAVATPVTVGLTVTAPGGCGTPDTASETFDLLPSPSVTATADPSQACVGDPVQFQADAADSPGPYAWQWDFGDGALSNQEDPSHVYDAAGVYLAVATATDQGDGCSTASAPARVAVVECVQDCLYRTLVADRETLDPTLVFLVPRTVDDVGLQGAPLRCPVSPGDRDAGVIGDGNELGTYQVNGPRTLTLRRAGSDLVLSF